MDPQNKHRPRSGTPAGLKPRGGDRVAAVVATAADAARSGPAASL